MNYKPFPEIYFTELKNKLSALKQSHKPLIAAFDADGTLWDTDLGENFFQFQIDNKCVDLPNDPWSFYLELKKKNNDPREAYAWLAQINQNQSLDQVRAWSEEAFNQIQPKPIFSEQKKIIDILLENNVQVYIVTASVKWAVEPGAKALGLSYDNVIGVETAILNGIITGTPIQPITYRNGKIEALLKKTNNVFPFFASGNTIGDFELLQAATDIKLAVSAASRDDKLFRSELELMQIAEKNNWLNHRFI